MRIQTNQSAALCRAQSVIMGFVEVRACHRATYRVPLRWLVPVPGEPWQILTVQQPVQASFRLEGIRIAFPDSAVFVNPRKEGGVCHEVSDKKPLMDQQYGADEGRFTHGRNDRPMVMVLKPHCLYTSW